MDLSVTYREVSKSILAICIETDRKGVLRNAIPGELPEIIGTGFVVREDGLVVTNDHVIKETRKYLKMGFHISAIAFAEVSFGRVAILMDVLGALPLKKNPIKDAFEYEDIKPDIGFIRVKYQGLPRVNLNENHYELEEGKEVATAGFPFGTKIAKLNRSVGPVLQKGIISSVFPFRGSAPHGFAINVRNHAGASGSPVFIPTSGEVVGIHHASLNVPSNFSLIVPSRYIVAALGMDLQKVGIVPFDETTPDYHSKLAEIEAAERPKYEEALRMAQKNRL